MSRFPLRGGEFQAQDWQEEMLCTLLWNIDGAQRAKVRAEDERRSIGESHDLRYTANADYWEQRRVDRLEQAEWFADRWLAA